jgi:hypothetical protein
MGAAPLARERLVARSLHRLRRLRGRGVGAGLLYFAWVEAALRPRFAALAVKRL